jgi:hypothetical protein
LAFIATLVYELDPSTSPEAQKLLRAELVGRRYNDRYEGKRLPSNAVWIRRTGEGETVDDLKIRCGEELGAAVAAVARAGLAIRLVRAWAQVSGAGTYGLVEVPGPSAPGAGGGKEPEENV